MPSITVKNIPEEIYSKVRKQAEAHHRSINSEIIHCLEKNVRSQKITPADILQEARRLRQKAKGKISGKEIKQAINHGRP